MFFSHPRFSAAWEAWCSFLVLTAPVWVFISGVVAPAVFVVDPAVGDAVRASKNSRLATAQAWFHTGRRRWRTCRTSRQAALDDTFVNDSTGGTSLKAHVRLAEGRTKSSQSYTTQSGNDRTEINDTVFNGHQWRLQLRCQASRPAAVCSEICKGALGVAPTSVITGPTWVHTCP